MDISLNFSDTVLKTERLILRPLAAGDLLDFFTYASVPGVGESAGWKHHESIQETERILQMMIEEQHNLALYHTADYKMIGTIGMHMSWANEDEHLCQYKAKEIGYVLSKEYWGQGLMPEAVNAIIQYAFESLGLEAITCCHFDGNEQSRRVIEKSGFRFVKKGKHEAKQIQQTFVDLRYVLLKNDGRKGKS